MKIDNCPSFIYAPKVSFTSCERKYKAAEKLASGVFSKTHVYTTTHLFRKHLDWKKYISYVIGHFHNQKKVNIYSLGCSDGSEAYSYAIALADRLSPEQAHSQASVGCCRDEPAKWLSPDKEVR